MYSLIIKNGKIFDGTGAEPFYSDIGIKSDKISYVGDLSGEQAGRIIDASGLAVAPGFIDLTSHSDVYGTLFYRPKQESMLKQGVTTILIGNCGESLAPIVKKESLEELERWTNLSLNADWNSMGEYLDSLSKISLGVNVATLAGQETLRRNANLPKERELLLERSLKEGAWGISGNFLFHGSDGELREETLSLLKIIKKHKGVFKIHLRDEGKNFLPAVAAIADIARSSKTKIIISHMKAIGREAWDDCKSALSIIERAKSEGAEIYCDVFPYLRTGSQLLALLPDWAREGSNEEILSRLKNEKSGNKIVSALQKITIHADRILIASAGEDKKIVGRTLETIAGELGTSAEEAIIEILKLNKLNAAIFGKTINPNNLISILKKDYVVVASDGAGYDLSFAAFGNLAHPRSFGAFPRFLSVFAPKADLKMEEAIKKITSLPASILELSNRGVIKSGFTADIAIFDLGTFKDLSTYKKPFLYSEGMKFVVVSGDVALSGGAILDTAFGKVLRKNR